jgi:hypothetical protein
VNSLRQTSDELLAEIEETRQLALNFKRAYVTRAGELREVAQPDFRAALEATRLKAMLTGRIGDGKQMTIEDLKRELDSLGYRLVPKRPLPADGAAKQGAS